MQTAILLIPFLLLLNRSKKHVKVLNEISRNLLRKNPKIHFPCWEVEKLRFFLVFSRVMGYIDTREKPRKFCRFCTSQQGNWIFLFFLKRIREISFRTSTCFLERFNRSKNGINIAVCIKIWVYFEVFYDDVGWRVL